MMKYEGLLHAFQTCLYAQLCLVTYQNACMSHVDYESPHSHTPPPRFPGHWKSRINTRAITYISHPPPDFQNRQRLAILEIEKQVWRVVLKFLSWIFGDLKEIFSTMWKNRANKIMKCWYQSSLLFEERKNFAVSLKCVCVKVSITWDKISCVKTKKQKFMWVCIWNEMKCCMNLGENFEMLAILVC